MSPRATHRVVIGDSRRMLHVPSRSVHLVVTSPPYWQLKDYGHEDQIGYHDSLTAYINDLNLVWKECERVLHPGCRLCVNIGDQFARAILYGRYKLISIQSEIIRFCETVGFDYMGTIIWQKVTTVNTTGGAVIMGSFPYPRNGIVKMDYEYILMFKKPGKAPVPSPENKEKSRLSTEDWNRYFYGHWNFSGVRQDKHLAAFPEELPRRLIRMFTFVGETVLDPFLGSGTTSVAARDLQRSSIGYEINPQFRRIILDRLGAGVDDLVKCEDVTVVEQRPLTADERSHEALPYRFTDPHEMDKLIDPKKLRFGSRIDGKESGTARRYKVEQVLGHDQLLLDTGLVVRMAGVSVAPQKREAAKKFLTESVLGQTVMLQFGARVHNKDGSLLAKVFSGDTAVADLLRREGLAAPLPARNGSRQSA